MRVSALENGARPVPRERPRKQRAVWALRVKSFVTFRQQSDPQISDRVRLLAVAYQPLKADSLSMITADILAMASSLLLAEVDKLHFSCSADDFLSLAIAQTIADGVVIWQAKLRGSQRDAMRVAKGLDSLRCVWTQKRMARVAQQVCQASTVSVKGPCLTSSLSTPSVCRSGGVYILLFGYSVKELRRCTRRQVIRWQVVTM